MNLVCLILGHKYRIVQHFNNRHRRIKCYQCEGDWAMSDEHKSLLNWDTEFEEMYTSFGHKINEPMFGYNGLEGSK